MSAGGPIPGQPLPRDPAPGDEDPEAELVPEDDAIIGRAFRVSLVVLLALALVAGLAAWLLSRSPEEAPPREVAVEAPRAPRTEVSAPEARFVDVAGQAGIDFVHENGARGEKLLPETMGGGCAFFDHDGDGDPDLLLVNGCPWPGDGHDGEEQATQALYLNDGAGSFRDGTAAAGLDRSFYGMGVAAGDVDCDGDPDLLFTAVGPDRFFRNEGGRYAEEDVGVAGDPEAWSSCAAFFDADGDGDLDLYVGRYVRWSRETDFEVDYRLTGIGRSYGPPMNFEGTHSAFYVNEGGGRFRDASEEAGFLVENPATNRPMGKALGVRPVDLEGDGDLDLVVANDTVRNFCFRNRGDGTFEEVGGDMGIAFDRNGQATGAMGIDGGWYRNDEALGFALGNFANEMTSLYVSQNRPDLFADESIGEGIGAPTRVRLSFGLFFFDFDLDGRLDLLQANGHLEDEINKVQVSQHYEQPAQLFWNAGAQGRSSFVEVEPEHSGDLARAIVGRGAAYADIDGDGDLDALLTQAGGRPLLLRNDQDLGHHWLRVRLVGAPCNRDAIGARLELRRGGGVQRAEVMPTRSYLSQVELPVTFGLGTSADAGTLVVRWPDGKVDEHAGLEVDRLHVIERGL